MNHVFHRQINSSLPVAVAGEGVHIIDSTGKRYLDASGGAAVSCLGHDDRDVRRAMAEQMDRLAFAHTGFFTSQVAEDLADLLIEDAPEGLERVYYVSGGSEAVESALKLARQYFLEIGQPARHHFIARRQSYHGNTLGALGVGGNTWRRDPFTPLMVPGAHVSPCYAYRDMWPGESESAYAQRLADELERTILELGPNSVAAFVAEPVVGATGGVIPAVPGYFRKVREICDRYGVLLILDEVMCGMGRTGSLFACEQEGVSPDLLTIAKGLGAGYQPIGATLVSARIYSVFERTSATFPSGHTYNGHPVACAAALAVQKTIRERRLLENVWRQGAYLERLLHETLGDHAHVGDIRGRGLFWGIELVADRESKQPFASSFGLAGRIKRHAMARGLICYPNGGTIDGQRGDHVLLAPPFIVSESDVEAIVERLSGALDGALAEAGAKAA